MNGPNLFGKLKNNLTTELFSVKTASFLKGRKISVQAKTASHKDKDMIISAIQCKMLFKNVEMQPRIISK